MISYIAFHEDKGIYLGVYMGYAMFSNTDMPSSSKAVRFENKEEVHIFFEKMLPKLAAGISAIAINTNSNSDYISVSDILKSGHKKHTESMIENIPALSESIH
jgi:hypothetical protein